MGMKGEDILILIVLCGALVLGFVLGASLRERVFQKQAITHGAAQYNPTNGTFEWKESK